MSRSTFPPTPEASTDIAGQEKTLPACESLSLPPAAIDRSSVASTSTMSSIASTSDSSYHPTSPSSPTKRKRPSLTGRDDYALPPPPTRSRKIIQMKPKQAAASASEDHGQTPATIVPAQPDRIGGQHVSTGKKKANGTVAGRKIARKTAHSLIERRRRSKMNEEFGVLRDLIPACKGQEMHKLAILQASIEYTRYLEQCIADLQASKITSRPSTSSQLAAQDFRPATTTTDVDENMNEGGDEDEEMLNSTSAPASLSHIESQVTLPPLSRITTAATMSPVFNALDQQTRRFSTWSASQPTFSPYILSTTASPLFAGQHPSEGKPPLLTLPSPRLAPQNGGAGKSLRPLEADDHEATAALLMLNTDRRSWTAERGRGMSVKDLLSS
ncbi:hypothetical protein LTR66_005975 [Elasticomyces elasticus]|nr:hypothetical protein LTR66_005975 [Elasticomyces elasticus]